MEKKPDVDMGLMASSWLLQSRDEQKCLPRVLDASKYILNVLYCARSQCNIA